MSPEGLPCLTPPIPLPVSMSQRLMMPRLVPEKIYCSWQLRETAVTSVWALLFAWELEKTEISSSLSKE